MRSRASVRDAWRADVPAPARATCSARPYAVDARNTAADETHEVARPSVQAIVVELEHDVVSIETSLGAARPGESAVSITIDDHAAAHALDPRSAFIGRDLQRRRSGF